MILAHRKLSFWNFRRSCVMKISSKRYFRFDEKCVASSGHFPADTWRQNGVVTSFWRNNDVIIMPCAHWVCCELRMHMMTSSNGSIFRVTDPLCGEFTGHRWIHWSPMNSPHKDQWRRALVFSLICAWINGWVNNREAGDLRRHRVHYDVIVMQMGPFEWTMRMMRKLSFPSVFTLLCLWY